LNHADSACHFDILPSRRAPCAGQAAARGRAFARRDRLAAGLAVSARGQEKQA